MAKVYSLSEPVNYSEKIVFDKLKKLNDNYYLINNKSFSEYKSGIIIDREIDFILLNRNTGIFSIEVKGNYEVDDTGWYMTDKNGKREKKKNPFDQAKRNAYAFIEHISRKYYNSIPLKNLGFTWNWAVVFPFGNYKGLRNQYENYLEKKDLSGNIEKAISKFANADDSFNRQINSLWSKLANNIETESDYKLFLDKYNEKLVKLSDIQFRFIREYDRGIIRGKPGTGKSVMAIQKSKHLAQKGFNVLLVCHNRALGKYLHHNVKGNNSIKAVVWCDYMLETVKKYQEGFEISEKRLNDYTFYHFELPERFIKIIDKTDERPTAVVVDEAQNFSLGLWKALEKYVTGENPPFLIFYDSKQNLYQGDVTVSASEYFLDKYKGPEKELPMCYRLSANIIEYIEKLFPGINLVTDQEKLDSHLSYVKEYFYRDNNEQLKYLDEILMDLKKKKYNGKNIAMLSFERSTEGELFWKDKNIAGFSVVFGPSANKILTDIKENELLLYSVGRYIGLEADVIILTDLPSKNEILNDTESIISRKFLLGASRAKLILYCLFRKT